MPASSQNIRKLTLGALSMGCIAVCAWLSVPTTVPFTLQTFAVFLTLLLLGGKWGFLTILAYLLLGFAGVPVFAGFLGGPAVLLGATGGYLLGFLGTAAVYWLITRHFGQTPFIQTLALLAGLLACYGVGTAWFAGIYLPSSGAAEWSAVLSSCVLPFLLPDLCKLALALMLARTMAPHLRKGS